MNSASNAMPPAGIRDFIAGGVSILVASRDRDLKPVVARACGCIAGDDGAVAVFVPTERAGDLLDAIAVTGTVAVVFSEPATHRTIQLKADDARIVRSVRGQSATCDRYRRLFAAELERLGYGSRMATSLVDDNGGPVSAIRFTPAATFDQTPGPHAGEPLEIAR